MELYRGLGHQAKLKGNKTGYNSCSFHLYVLLSSNYCADCGRKLIRNGLVSQTVTLISDSVRSHISHFIILGQWPQINYIIMRPVICILIATQYYGILHFSK